MRHLPDNMKRNSTSSRASNYPNRPKRRLEQGAVLFVQTHRTHIPALKFENLDEEEA
jgi:hypothetical protein